MGDINVLITNVSTVNLKTFNEKDYVDADNKEIKVKGEVTNEAPIKILIKKLADSNNVLDRLILIESDDVRKKILVDDSDKEKYEKFKDNTHVGFLIGKIINYCKENNYANPLIKDIEIADEPTDDSVIDAITEMKKEVELLTQSLEGDDVVNVYIESNGGVRYVMTMLIAIINLLEKTNKKIKLREIYSMVYPNNENPEEKGIRVRNTLMTYASINLLSAVDEFVHYGRIESLKKYFELRFSQGKSINEDVKKDIKKCLDKLENVANDLQLCRTGLIMEHFYGAKDNIYVLLHNFKKCYEKSDDANAKIFMYVAKVILNEYEILYDSKGLKEKLKEGQEIKSSLPRIIEWCIEKDYIQQAITFCSEQIPKYLVESGKVVVSDRMWEYMEPKMDKKYEKNYYLLVRGLREVYNDKILKNIKGLIIKDKTVKGIKMLQIIKEKEEILAGYANDITKEKERTAFFADKDSVKKLLEDIMNSIVINSIYSDKKLNMYVKEVEDFNKCIEGKYNINKWISNSMIKLDWNNQKIKISNDRKATVFTLIKGMDDENKHSGNIKNNSDRSKRFFEDKAILNAYYDEIVVKDKFVVDDVFNDLFDKLFVMDIDDALRNKYIKEVENCSKYDSTLYFDSKKVMIGTDLSVQKIRKIFYLYGMCKEQRNYSNHANSEGETVVLDVMQLKVLVKYLINELKE